MIIIAYPALYLGGTPSQDTGTSPPSSQLLENRLYISPLLCSDILVWSSFLVFNVSEKSKVVKYNVFSTLILIKFLATKGPHIHEKDCFEQKIPNNFERRGNKSFDIALINFRKLKIGV